MADKFDSLRVDSDVPKSPFMEVFDSDAHPADSNEEPVDPNIGLSIDQVIQRIRVLSEKSFGIECTIEEIRAFVETAFNKNYASSKKEAGCARDWCLSEHLGGFRIFRDTPRSASKKRGISINCVDRLFFDRDAAVAAGVNLTADSSSKSSSKLPDLSMYMKKRKVLVVV